MALRGVACLDCLIECDKSHKGRFLHIVDRFFKIMFGEDRAKFLYLPPESAKIVKHLTNQETQIEDSSGQRWAVTLSLVNGSLAFQKGWEQFYLDHGLKVGELLVFEYTGRSHFTVQIYGTSARERTNFNNEVPCRRKKRRRCQGTPSRDISISAPHDELQNRKTNLAVENAGVEGSELLPIPVDVEDPICMIINQNVGYHEEQRILYDLSLELDNKTADANKYEGAAIVMLDPHTESEQSDVNLDDASGTKFSPSCSRVLEPTNPDGDDAMEQTKSTSEDAQMVEKETELITSDTGGIAIDKFETALDAGTALSHSEIADENGMLDSASGCNVQDGKEPSMMLDHPQMNSPLVEPTNSAGDDAAEQAKTTGGISLDMLETALDAETALSEIVEQIRKKVDDTQLAPHSRQAGSHSGNSFVNRFFEKPSFNSEMKVMLDNVCNVQDVKLGKPEPVSVSPSVGGSKIAERQHAAKSKFGEFSLSSSTVKNPSGLRAIKKEVMMEEDTANVFYQVSSGGNKSPLMWNQPQMISPVRVKVEPDLPYETDQSGPITPPFSVCPFSVEVENKSYLELPIQIMTARAKRLRPQTMKNQQMIVYLRDSARRAWPVVYSEYAGVKAFIGNWSEFCVQNNIKPGDKCSFQAEEHVASIVLRVDVARGSR